MSSSRYLTSPAPLANPSASLPLSHFTFISPSLSNFAGRAFTAVRGRGGGVFAYERKATVWEAFITRILSAEGGREASPRMRAPRRSCTSCTWPLGRREGRNNTGNQASPDGQARVFSLFLFFNLMIIQSINFSLYSAKSHLKTSRSALHKRRKS